MEFEGLSELSTGGVQVSDVTPYDLYMFECACLGLTQNDLDLLELRRICAEAVSNGPAPATREMVLEEDLACVSSLYFPNDPFTQHS